jgi:uncharacterized coiled-coil protein SlyX
MSVHQESLDLGKPAERQDEAPELEYRAVSHDSLSMFLAAIGGAILGMLLTLLILALINGGTLSFSGGERLAVFEATLERVNDNVGAVSANVDLVSQQAQALSDQLLAAQETLRAEMAGQDENIASLDAAVSQLDVTRQQFDLFMGALSQAMSDMQTVAPATASAAEPAVAPTAAAPASRAPALAEPAVFNSADVAADAVAVVLFTDANGNSLLDEGEMEVMGATVALLNADGEAIASQESTTTGALFSDLRAGEYTISVEDAAGYSLTGASEAPVTVNADASEGQIVYIPVTAE